MHVLLRGTNDFYISFESSAGMFSTKRDFSAWKSQYLHLSYPEHRENLIIQSEFTFSTVQWESIHVKTSEELSVQNKNFAFIVSI